MSKGQLPLTNFSDFQLFILFILSLIFEGANKNKLITIKQLNK